MAQLCSDIDAEIRDFFSRVSATRADCDSLVRARFGEPIAAVSIQGATSYTVIAGPNRDKIVQFRNIDAQLDLETLHMARGVHGDVVPLCASLGQIGDDEDDDDSRRRLAVYEMNRLPGDNFAVVRSSLADEPRSQLATVRSLAKFVGKLFFAQAWRRPVSVDQATLFTIAAELSSSLDTFHASDVLTPRLRPALDEVRDHLPTLVSGEFPLALNHSDLSELNILVDGDSGVITGVVDWADAGIQPFGLTLYVLEKFIGGMGPGGWVYFDNAAELRDEFWRAFVQHAGQVSHSQMQSIRVARKAGYLLRYGTICGRGQRGVVGVESMSIEKRRRYLEAIL